MRILIDECLPDEIKDHIGALGHECETTRRAGFGAKKNGELLALVEGKREVLLTSDKNIKYQQNRAGRKLSILVIRSKSNRMVHLLPFLPACVDALRTIEPGKVVEVGSV